MGRRRWRFVTIAAFLFFIGNIQCQDEDDFYYTPVERSFAQVQPQLFPHNRPATFFEDADSIRIAPHAQQPIYNNGQLRVPGPNYNQNPSPFQVPIGRSQSGSSFYLNQPDFGSVQKHRLRPALPHNYQFISTTKKPDLSQIHSSVYQNDPSRPETFLGQITLNNPDVDYLQNNRFKNVPFDGNSLKLNSQNGHITRDEEFDNDELDLFDHHKVTTFNPNKLVYKQPQYSPKPNGARFSHFSSLTDSKKNIASNQTSKANITVKQVNTPLASLNNRYQASSTEFKALLELQPLLEDDISESSLKELIKNPKQSDDVQVIKSSSKNIAETNEDSKPDASSMNADNMPNNKLDHIAVLKETNSTDILASKHTSTENIDENESIDETNQSGEDDTEYVEYYDDELSNTTIAPHSTERVTDIYDEYDASEEPDHHMDYQETNTTESFDVLLTKSNNTMVKDDNFKHFIDTTVIDQPEVIDDSKTDNTTNASLPIENPIVDIPSILGEEVVSVVTTKSVVNGTISIPHNTYDPTEKTSFTNGFSYNNLMLHTNEANETIPVTTDNWVVVASVQTSRSISGARFLPFPTVEQDEKKQVLTEDDEEETSEQNNKSNSKDQRLDNVNLVNSSSSTENINDKLDSIQSELSSAVLSGNIDNENKNIELIPESAFERNSSTSVETTTTLLNLFTLKSTQGLPLTELSSPGPLPVTIKKFMPRTPLFTTPKPKRKPSIVTVADTLDGLLPAGFRQPSYKNKRTSTSTSTTTTTTSTLAPIVTTEEHMINGTQGRSIGLNMKNKVILLDDKSLLPKEYIPKDSKTPDTNFKRIKEDDINKFLPVGYKEPVLEAPEIKTDPGSNKIKEVDVSAFLPKDYNLSRISTEKPRTKLIDKIKEVDISSFLPKDYKVAISSTEKSKEKTNILDSIQELDVSAFLPKGYNLSAVATEKPETKPKLFKKIPEVDISAFLPKNYNTNGTITEKPKSKLEASNNVKEIDISAFLPKDYNINSTSTPNSKSGEQLPKNIIPVDITAFLPPGFKLNDTQEEKHDNINSEVADVSDLLPPGFKLNENESSELITTTKSPSVVKLVFPSRPGGKTLRKTTPKPGGMGPSPVTPKIQKGWPTRASTEFTGWPSPPTTPLSIEKLLEALANEKVGGSTSPKNIWSPEITTQAVTTTTTTTTTTPPPPSTTPGICAQECEIAATIKIVEGVKWVPELQDPHTEEWQKLAREIKDELNSVYSNSDLSKWFKNVHIDSFSKGSVLVDYFIELNNVEEKLSTIELKKRFHNSLKQIKSETINNEEKSPEESVNLDVMLGDQPDEEKMKKSNERMSKTTPKLEMGKFIMDPAYTEFIVVQKHEEPKEEVSEEESVLPQWGIAVIVIAMASLLFVVIFGVTVLVNRQKNTKLKQPIPLSEDMLRELDKNHMGGFEDNHQLKERDLPYLPTGKRMSTAFIEQLAYPNPGDSWRSEWTPQMQKYMQHYATDSGRGTQLYGAAGNIYGYGGSQLYGHTGGGSQIYGYTGEYPRSHHSRRRSEYDSNF